MNRLQVIHSRDELIGIGVHIAAAVQMVSSTRPVMICLNGDLSSGKSLPPLATHQAMFPEQYPNGITTEMSANQILNPALVPDTKVVFADLYGYRQQHAVIDNALFDTVLKYQITNNPAMRVCFVSNWEMAPEEAFDPSKSLRSEVLDLSLHLRTMDGDFVREITTGYVSPRLQAAFDQVEARNTRSITPMTGLVHRPRKTVVMSSN